MDSDFVHGSSSSYRKCADAPGGKPCEQCITGKREADTERQRRRRERLAGSVTEPVGKPAALRLVTDETPAHDVAQASRQEAPPSPAASRSPAPAARATRSRSAEFDMPHLWSTAASEPAWAQEHRDFLASVIADVLANPEHYCMSPCFADDTSKAEKKDFTRLGKEFVKANKGIIVYRWWVDRFVIHSPEYIGEDDTADDETGDETAEPAFEIPARQQSQPSEPASKPARQPSTPKPIPGAPLVYPFQSATGLCKINVAGEAVCQNTTDGSIWFDDRPICGAHANYLAQWYSARITRKRNASGTQKAASSRAPFRIIPSTRGMCEVMMQQDANSCSRFAGYSASEAQYTVDNHPACQDHYNGVRQIYPERCRFFTQGQWFMAPLGIQYG